MKKILSIFFTFFLIIVCNAQRHELGISLGGANVIGDVGKGNYINPLPRRIKDGGSTFLPISFGALYRFNFNPHMGFRANISLSSVGDGNYNAGEEYKYNDLKSYSFKNNIFEGAVLFEYNFFNINDNQEKAHSPYLFGGVGLASYAKKTIGLDDQKKFVFEDDGRENTLVLPFGIGYKLRFNYNWILALETGFRYTNKDNLDYSNISLSNEELQKLVDDNTIGLNQVVNDPTLNRSKIGNLSNKDWYVITGLTLTYSFGRPACYCN